MIRTSLLAGCPKRAPVRAKAASKKAAWGLDAHGWKSDLSNEEILERLLALNLERGKVKGIIPSVKE